MVHNNWSLVPIARLLEKMDAGTWGEEPSTKEESTAVIRSTNYTKDLKLNLDKIAFRKLTEKHKSEKMLKKGDILLEKSGGGPSQPVGRVVLFEKEGAYSFANFLQRLSPKLNEVFPKFLYYMMAYNYLKGKTLIHQKQTTGIRNLDYKEYLSTAILLPPLKEQQKIAEILSSVDEAIEKTEAIIKQTETVKKGLMQQLLTKGIGHTEFKQTEVGQMPKTWEVKSLKETTEKIQDGTHFSPKTVEEGVLYVTSRNIRPFKFDWNTTEYISQEDHEKIYKRCNVKRGDVLLTKDGANTGNALVNTIDEEFSLLSSVCFIRCSEVLNNMFLCQYLNSEMFRKEMALKMTGNAIKRLTLTIINNLKIPFPSIEEQNHIAQILCSFDQRREVEEQRLNKLSNLKKSLMQSLLTGKVRVNVDQLEVLV